MDKYNCPNCGAPITGPKCEYCGTVFEKREPAVLYADGVAYPITSYDRKNLTTSIFDKDGEKLLEIPDEELVDITDPACKMTRLSNGGISAKTAAQLFRKFAKLGG